MGAPSSESLVSPDIDFDLSLTSASPPTQQVHAFTPFISPPSSCPTYPFLTLLILGGHPLLLATSPTVFRILATTVDEAIGNAFDKVALLQISYEGKAAGAALQRLCSSGSVDGKGRRFVHVASLGRRAVYAREAR